MALAGTGYVPQRLYVSSIENQQRRHRTCWISIGYERRFNLRDTQGAVFVDSRFFWGWGLT